MGYALTMGRSAQQVVYRGESADGLDCQEGEEEDEEEGDRRAGTPPILAVPLPKRRLISSSSCERRRSLGLGWTKLSSNWV